MNFDDLTLEVAIALWLLFKAASMALDVWSKGRSIENKKNSAEKEAIQLLNESVSTMQKQIKDLQSEVERLKNRNKELESEAAKVPLLEKKISVLREAYGNEARRNMGLTELPDLLEKQMNEDND